MKVLFLSLLSIIKSDVAKIHGFGYNAKHVNGDCPDIEKVRRDFRAIKKIAYGVRTFGLSECNQGELLVRAAEEIGIKVSLGMWVSDNTQDFNKEFALLKSYFPKYKKSFQNNIAHIIVGTRTMYRKENNDRQVAFMIKQVKDYLKSQGLSNLLTTSDTKENWNPSALTRTADVMFVNEYPYWNGIAVDQAVEDMFKRIAEVKARVPNKKFIIGSTGWPEGGKSAGAALPSKENQLKYFNKFVCRAQKEKLDYFWFSAFNEDWKVEEPGANWGVFNKDYTLKNGYKFPVKC